MTKSLGAGAHPLGVREGADEVSVSNILPPPPDLPTTEEREARKQAEWAELEKVTASFDVGRGIP